MRERQMQRKKIITLMRFYRNHKVRDLFNRYKKITFTTPKPVKLLGFSEKEAHEILHQEPGAHFREIDKINQKIKGLDKALEIIHYSKAEKSEVNRLKEILERGNIAILSQEITKMVETRVEEIRDSMDKEKKSLREAFQYLMQETKAKAEQSVMEAVQTKVSGLETMIHAVSLENKILRDQLGQHLHKINFNTYESQLAEHNMKLDRMETFNRELRSRVDYFINVI